MLRLGLPARHQPGRVEREETVTGIRVAGEVELWCLTVIYSIKAFAFRAVA